MAASIFQSYLLLNIFIVIALATCVAIHLSGKALSFSHQLSAAYGLVTLILILPVGFHLFPESDFIVAKSQIWTTIAASGPETVVPGFALLSSPGSVMPATASTPWYFYFLCLVAVGICIGCTQLLIQTRKLSGLMKTTFQLKKIGRIHIRITDNPVSPFSCRTFSKLLIVIPSAILTEPEKMRIALAHEFQHHRQLDTVWVHVLNLLKIFCFLNPAVYLLTARIYLLQEFACDESLIGHRRISPKAYGRCLLWVANLSRHSGFKPVGTAGMTKENAEHTLTRRVKVMMSESKSRYGRSSKSGIATLLTGVSLAITTMTGIAVAANQSIRDRTITLQQAIQMTAATSGDSGFPTEVNELVLEQLNRYVGTAGGRKYMRSSLQRMLPYKEMINEHLEKYNLPPELIAIPIVESGFKNNPPTLEAGTGAGLWMFIKPTARNFGLKVNAQIDQRLDTTLETDAAMRLLAALNLRFGNWGLALLGYNAGEGTVQKGIDSTNSRDAWTLIQAGHENDPNYLAKVIAANLVMKHPQLLD